MKPILIMMVLPFFMLTACQESLKSSDYYREHLDEAQQTEKNVKTCGKRVKSRQVI